MPRNPKTRRQSLSGASARAANRKEIYKQRAASAECVNAQARNRELTQFLVRGVDKVTTSALWYALTNNMVCFWRLIQA